MDRNDRGSTMLRRTPLIVRRCMRALDKHVGSIYHVFLLTFEPQGYFFYWICQELITYSIMTLNDVREYFQVENLYEVLKVPNDCHQDDIKKAYFRRSLELHPDKTTDPKLRIELKEKFQILSEVYRILSDTKSRENYDSQLRFSSPSGRPTDINSTIYDVVPLRHCDEHEHSYSYDCRCSGHFTLSKSLLRNSHATAITNKQELSFIVNCDSCSNCVKIISWHNLVIGLFNYNLFDEFLVDFILFNLCWLSN